jgi:hypothetical protein
LSTGCIHVKNPQVLGSEILHRYFRHSKYSSFQRQLNYFGFRKTQGKGKMSPCTYTNDELRGGPLRSLLNVKRKSSGNPKPSQAVVAVSSSESEEQGEEEEEEEEEAFSEGDTSTDDGYYYYGRASKRHRGMSAASSITAPQGGEEEEEEEEDGEKEEDQDMLTSAEVLSDEEAASQEREGIPFSPRSARKSVLREEAMEEGEGEEQNNGPAGSADGAAEAAAKSVKPPPILTAGPAPAPGQTAALVVRPKSPTPITPLRCDDHVPSLMLTYVSRCFLPLTTRAPRLAVRTSSSLRASTWSRSGPSRRCPLAATSATRPLRRR